MRGLLKSDSVDATSPTYHLVNSEGNQVKGGWMKAPALNACVYKCGIVIHAWLILVDLMCVCCLYCGWTQEGKGVQ